MKSYAVLFGITLACAIMIMVAACSFGGRHHKSIHYKNRIKITPCATYASHKKDKEEEEDLDQLF